MKNKPRVIKDYEKLNNGIQEQIKLAYPLGFDGQLISYTDRNGNRVSALPFETDDYYYLVRMTRTEARKIILEDDDYDDDGNLKQTVKDSYSDKYSDLDYMSDYIDDVDDDD